MPIVFDLIAVAGILTITLYGALQVWRSWQETRLATAYFGREIEILQEEIGRQQRVSQVAVSRAKDAWEGFRKFELRGKILEAEGICSFYFAPHDARHWP